MGSPRDGQKSSRMERFYQIYDKKLKQLYLDADAKNVSEDYGKWKGAVHGRRVKRKLSPAFASNSPNKKRNNVREQLKTLTNKENCHPTAKHVELVDQKMCVIERRGTKTNRKRSKEDSNQKGSVCLFASEEAGMKIKDKGDSGYPSPHQSQSNQNADLLLLKNQEQRESVKGSTVEAPALDTLQKVKVVIEDELQSTLEHKLFMRYNAQQRARRNEENDLTYWNNSVEVELLRLLERLSVKEVWLYMDFCADSLIAYANKMDKLTC